MKKVDKSVINKIKKLLALANDHAASEGEAANAMTKAHAILAEHNLSHAEVDIHASGWIQEKKIKKDSNAMWKIIIYQKTAKLFFCESLSDNFDGRTARGQYFFGTAENIEVALQMANYFCRTIIQISNAQCKGRNAEYKNNFRYGCASRLADRIKERIAASKKGELKDAGGSTMPATMDLYQKHQKAAFDFIRDKGYAPNENRSYGSDSAAYQAGSNAANGISLDQLAPPQRAMARLAGGI